MKLIIGVGLLMFAFLFGMAQTKYFGNNWIPETIEEMICDTLAFGLFLIGMILIYKYAKES